MEKRRTVLALVLIVVGAGLLAYGVFRNAVAVSSGEPNRVQVAAQSESSVVQEVARGGLTRDEAGQIKTTAEPGKKAADACPT